MFCIFVEQTHIRSAYFESKKNLCKILPKLVIIQNHLTEEVTSEELKIYALNTLKAVFKKDHSSALFANALSMITIFSKSIECDLFHRMLSISRGHSMVSSEQIAFSILGNSRRIETLTLTTRGL